MGRILGIELKNFKSYKGVSRIGFGDSFFTSIIGPNGAGKSNMMDAISFVLGIKSNDLRSQNLKDLIYREPKSINENMEDSEINNTPLKAHIVAVYQKDNGEILNLKRVITISGNSEYKINNKSVTALNYFMILESENILIKAKNFLVFQGDVEQIASQSPKDLTKLIELISGSCEFEKEYKKHVEDLDKAHELTNSIFSRKKSLNIDYKQYKNQLAEKEDFEGKMILKEKLISEINLYKIYHNEIKHKELIDDLQKYKNSLKIANNDFKKKEINFKNATADFFRKSLDSKKTSNKIDQITMLIELLKRDIIPLVENKKQYENKIINLNKRKNENEILLKTQSKTVLYYEKQLKDANKLFNEFERKNKIENEFDFSTQIYSEYETLRIKFLSSGGSELEEKINFLNFEKDTIKKIVSEIQNQKNDSLERLEELKLNIQSDLKLRLDDVFLEINEVLSQKKEKLDKKNCIIQQKEKQNHEEFQLKLILKDVLQKVNELSSQKLESKKQKKLRENVNILKKNFHDDDIKGLVCDLVYPSDKKYDIALTTAIGKNINSILVKTSSIGYKCIEILKERRMGTASFIPLDSVITKSLNFNYLRSINQNAQPTILITKYNDKSLEQAINYLVGDSLIVENIEIAKSLKWHSNNKIKNKIITLDGSTINKNGMMTGGSVKNHFNDTISSDKNLLNVLILKKNELFEQISKLKENIPKNLEINGLMNEINELEEKLPLLRNQKLFLQNAIDEKNVEIDFINHQIEKFDVSLKKNEENLENFEKKISELKSEVIILKLDIFKQFCLKFNFKNGIDDYENSHGSILREKAKDKLKYSKKISALECKLNFEIEKDNLLKQKEIFYQNNFFEYKNEFKKLTEKQKEIEDQIEKFQNEKTSFQDELKKSAEMINNESKILKDLEDELLDVEKKAATISEKIINLEDNIFKNEMNRVVYFKNCKMNNINIPLLNISFDDVFFSNDIKKSVKEVYLFDIDYSVLNDRYKEKFSEKFEAELQKNYNEVILDLEKLMPNNKAYERLKEVESKLKKYEKDHYDARQNEREICDKLKIIKNKRYEKFMAAFNHISAKIDPIYKQLTDSSGLSIGGSAYLTLEDNESPYDQGIKYHAMPPMKRFRDMELLSGGEKTIAALALLFAIHSYQPSPFFILDEVDAALDNSNVNRITNYIRKNASQTFQFIVISLKNSLYEKSDALVGIYRDQKENCSKTVTLDLREYPEKSLVSNKD